MKKIVFIVVLFFCTFLNTSFTCEAVSLKSIRLTEATPVFIDNQKVAVFMKGTTHTIINESDRFYHTVIGNEEVKFSKKKAIRSKVSPQQWKGVHPVRAITTASVEILDRPSVKANVIGQLQPAVTIHVQRLKGNYYPIILGGTTGYIHKNQLKVESGIPVLMYHDIVLKKEDTNATTLEIEKFTEQMNFLKVNGWTTITPEQLERWVRKDIQLPKKSVLITFDDGYASTIDLAYPILKKYNFNATSFLITSRINRPGMITDMDIVQTQDVYSYQNHTHAFHMFNSWTNLSLLQSESEFSILLDTQQANKVIEEIVGDEHQVTAHAYPYGKRSPQAIRALKNAGITSAYTIDEGNVFQGDSLYELKRQRVHSMMSLKEFADKLEGK